MCSGYCKPNQEPCTHSYCRRNRRIAVEPSQSAQDCNPHLGLVPCGGAQAHAPCPCSASGAWRSQSFYPQAPPDPPSGILCTCLPRPALPETRPVVLSSALRKYTAAVRIQSAFRARTTRGRTADRTASADVAAAPSEAVAEPPGPAMRFERVAGCTKPALVGDRKGSADRQERAFAGDCTEGALEHRRAEAVVVHGHEESPVVGDSGQTAVAADCEGSAVVDRRYACLPTGAMATDCN